ncbi:MAG: hypothetical protein IH840_05465, partial [Candidatus Heimdallarchaeota archaeon]|nr:hypothetical protein [Candidatus Heimdallarchaeota archaeon]
MAEDKDSSDDYQDNIYDDEEQPKKKGSVIKAIGIGIGATLILELVIGLALEAETNLVHRYISYMLGIAILFVASIYAKSTLKMFFLGTPVIIVSSFVFPLILPSTFTALMSPFVTIVPSLIGVRDSLAVTGLLDVTREGYIELLIFYGWAIDLIIAMVVGTLASIGLTGVVKLFAGKPNILTIFTFIYSLFFILIGVIL